MNRSTLFQSLIVALVSGLVVSFCNYIFLIKSQSLQDTREAKLQAYSQFIDHSRGFLSDPNLNEEQTKLRKQALLNKYYNEIILVADKDVVTSIESFVIGGGVAKANESDRIKKFRILVNSMRKDLDISTDDLGDTFNLFTDQAPQISVEFK